MEQWGDSNWHRTAVLAKPCPSAASLTTNLTWIGLGLNPCLRGERPVINCLDVFSTTGTINSEYFSRQRYEHLAIGFHI
jgi:hypothetical protein